MPSPAAYPDCLTHAAYWRKRAAETARSELRDVYEQTAESYEALSRHAPVCHRLVAENALRQGTPLPCNCSAVLASASVAGVADP